MLKPLTQFCHNRAVHIEAKLAKMGITLPTPGTPKGQSTHITQQKQTA